MPDLSALSLQTALTPVALSTVAAPLENAGNTAEPGTGAGTSAGSTTGTPSFDALLALQVTTQAATPETAAAILPESGKTLQDAAIAVAALPLASLPQAALLKVNVARPAPGADATADATVATADPLAELTTEGVASSDGAAEVAPQPDIALFAAIFAAPERLATPASVPGPQAEPTDTVPAPKAIAVPAAPATAIAPATPAAVAVAIASTAQIELAPSARTSAVPAAAQVAAPASGTPVETQASAIVMPAAATANNPVATAQAMPTAPAAAPAAPDAEPAAGDAPIAPASGDAAPRKQATSAPEAAGPQLAESPAPSAIPAAILAEAPVQTDAQLAVGTAARSEARAERIDFATLVDTLARAREEASPRTVNVAVTNTDFGRVSLRFDSNDNGLAVAMSSADPGFARAVSASADAAATSADTRNPNQQAPNSQAQGDARAQASDTNSQRQQQQGQSQQARADARFAANTQTSTRRDNDADTTGDSGIYA